MLKKSRPIAPVTAIAVSIAAIVVAGLALAQNADAPWLTHPKIANPASLSGARAESVYQAIRGQISRNYALAGDPVTQVYQSWTRFNNAPYRSPSHGERFVNHYANQMAIGYGRFEELTPLPPGAIVIKDSFTVTRDGDVMTGPLFMMEKMGSGFASRAGTWRFMMIHTDGSVMGETGGLGAENVVFCAECHRKAGADQDYLYFMPKEARIGY